MGRPLDRATATPCRRPEHVKLSYGKTYKRLSGEKWQCLDSDSFREDLTTLASQNIRDPRQPGTSHLSEINVPDYDLRRKWAAFKLEQKKKEQRDDASKLQIFSICHMLSNKN